jgi:flagellar biogenesis protein FliO
MPRLFRTFKLLLLVLGLTMALGASAWAQAPSAAPDASQSAEGYFLPDYQDPATHRNDDNWVGSAVNVLLKLGLVVGLIYGVAFLYRRGLVPKGLIASGNLSAEGMRVVGQIPLKGAQSLIMVEVGDRRLVVGSNGRETLVKLAEWGHTPKLSEDDKFEALFERVSRGEVAEEDAFSTDLERTLRQVIRPPEGQA